MFVKNAHLGDHNVCFYTSPQEKHKVLFSNLKAGLDKGYSAVYVASGENIEQVKVEMKNFGLRLNDPMKLKIVTSRQFYSSDEEFHTDRIIEQWRSLADESVDRGFGGLYVSSDLVNIFDYLTEKNMVEVWLKYENAIGRTFKFPMEAICAYHTDQIKSNEQALLQLIQAHKNTVTAKNLNFVNNEKIFMDTITVELENMLGKEATKIIFRFIEKRLKIPRNQIPDEIGGFNKALEDFLGSGATVIKKRMLENLHGKIEL